MPCLLFTWHAYGSWLPDQPKGYVRRSQGVKPQDVQLAVHYRNQQTEATVAFEKVHHLAVINELRKAAPLQQFRLHFVACEATHIHVLVSWRDERSWKQLRRSKRHSISLRLSQFENRKWLSRGGSRRQIRDRQHFDHLTNRYLPSHRGWKWSESRGLFE